MNKCKNGKYDRMTENFWSNVDFLMAKRNISVKSLAEKLGVGPRTLSSKKAMRSNPSLGSAAEIADAIGTSIDRLLYGSPE